MGKNGFDIVRERVIAGIVVVLFSVTELLLYVVGSSVFIITISFQIAYILLAALLEYVHVRAIEEGTESPLCCSPPIGILLLFIFFFIVFEIGEFLLALDETLALLHPTFWFLVWITIITWFLGKVIARLTFIMRHSDNASNLQE
jgi:hypothetical protein